MINIDFPIFRFKIKQETTKEFIYDEIRRNWFVLTPEEWVRQNFIQYLTATKKYPASLIAIEKEIKVGELKKRFDIVIYKDAIPWMIVECKQMDVQLKGNVLQQVLTYNLHLQANYLAITNGNVSFLWERKNDEFVEINNFPVW